MLSLLGPLHKTPPATRPVLCNNDTHPVVVDDLGDDSELASGGTLSEEDDTANLDETLEGRLVLL